MKGKKGAKTIAITLLVLVISIAAGLLMSAQLRSIPTRVSDPILPFSSLRETKEELYTEQAQLKAEITTLQDSIQDAQTQNENAVLSKNEISDLNNKKALAGLTKLSGVGVGIVLDDSQTISASEDSIIHAADIRDTINVLWASGAEGIAINGQRIVISTAVDCIVNTILINNVRLSNPYRIEAIGDQESMYSALNSSDALSSLRARKKNFSTTVNFRKMNSIQLPSYNGSLSTSIGN